MKFPTVTVSRKLPNSSKRFRDEGDRSRDRGDFVNAAAAYLSHLEEHPEDFDIWVQRGNCLKDCGDHEAALDSYNRALLLKPKDADLYLQLGHLHKLMQKFGDAADFYAKALEYDAGNVAAERELQVLRLNGLAPAAVRPSGPSKNQPLASTMKPSPSNAKSTQITGDFSEAIDVTIVGKWSKSNGIGLHAHAFRDTLNLTQTNMQFVDTRPAETSREVRRELGPKYFVDATKASRSLASVFCDVIGNSPEDLNFLKIPESIVKIAYAVFDSSRIPNFWVDRLNGFDAIAVPDPVLIEVLSNSGVTAPIFYLPLALDYSHLDGVTNDGLDRPFTFGCIAGFGLRKNLRALIDCFIETFGKNERVQLRIHSTLNFSNHFEQLSEYLQSLGADNVVLTCSELSKSQYASLLNSFDVYVNVSKGEGFSITPREALYLGKYTILSDNTAHKTIVKAGVALPVKTANLEIANFEGLGGLDCGYQHVPDNLALKSALTRAIVEKDRSSSLVNNRKSFARSFSVSHLMWDYRSIVLPKDVFLGSENSRIKDALITNDRHLFQKLEEVRSQKKNAIPPEERQRIVVVGHDGGFFSLFNTYVSYLVWNIGRPEVSSIIPDWRITRIQEHRKTDKFTSFCYGKRADGNTWLNFFHPVRGLDVDDSNYNDDQFLRNAIIFDGYNEQAEPLLTYIHAYKLYKKQDFQEWRKLYNSYYKKYIVMRDHIIAQVDTFQANNFDADYIIGCHVRHPSHGIEQPGKQMPTVELFIQTVIKRVAGISNYKVFLATDQDSVVDQFRLIFGDRLIYRSEVNRVDVDTDAKFYALSEAERAKEGFQIQHLTAADEAKWSARMGDEVIVDALLLSRCDTFVHVTSNIATAVSFMNPEIEMIYCE